MTSDSGATRQDTDYARHIQEVLHELHQLQQTPRLVTSPDDLEALEREIRHRTDRLGSLLVGHHLQQALDSAALQAEQERLVRQWPKPLKNDGRVKVGIRTAQGHTVPVWVTYYRRKGQRRADKRDAGVYAGLVLLGIYDRCTPGLAAEVSLLAAMLGSLHEAHDVLASRGVELDTKTVRLIAYRYAARARLAPQIDQAGFEDTVAGRRVVISSDGGRLRLRETKRGAKTTKAPLSSNGTENRVKPFYRAATIRAPGIFPSLVYTPHDVFPTPATLDGATKSPIMTLPPATPWPPGDQRCQSPR
jgi:hypothetical protein